MKYKKKFGQNFMQDTCVLENIIKCSNIDKKSCVLEVGPGSGNLSYYIANSCNKLYCFEIDIDLKKKFEQKMKNYNNYEVIYEDFLKSDLSKFKDIDNIYFISNVPYYITTPIIKKLIDSKIKFKKIVLMVQDEVGKRLSSKPKKHEYSAISVIVNYFYDVKYEFFVDRKCFYPVPNVDSCVISLSNKDRLYLKSYEFFEKFVFDAFKFKRKNLRNNLKNYDLDKIDKCLNKYNLSLKSRAEEVSLEIFVELSNLLCS